MQKGVRTFTGVSNSQHNILGTVVGKRSSSRTCALLDVGQVSYEVGLKLQQEARNLVEKGELDGILMLLEHDPVITVGRKGGTENLLVNEHELQNRGIRLVKTDRGGNITGHNPGQLVVYPILNLKRWKQDVHWYVHTIEEAVIRMLANYSLKALRKPGHPGIWMNDKKVAAIGVFISRWITSHGLALNVNNDLSLFASMIPCGIRCFGVTSLEQEGLQIKLNGLKKVFADEFSKLFECRLDFQMDSCRAIWDR